MASAAVRKIDVGNAHCTDQPRLRLGGDRSDLDPARKVRLRLVLLQDVKAIMAEVESINVSTDIYEQPLLIIGLFDDKAVYDDFEKKVRVVSGVKKLYWHPV